MDLRYCGLSAFYHNENRHPQLVMRDLGITYQKATPQSMTDQWWFFECDGIPDKLPPFLSELRATIRED